MLNKLLLATPLAALLLVPAAWAGPHQDFTLINKTGYDLDQVYVSPSNSTDWHEDILGRDVLGDDETCDIHFSRSEDTCLWDLRAVYTDNSAVVWEDIDLCAVSFITIRYDEKSDRTSATFR